MSNQIDLFKQSSVPAVVLMKPSPTSRRASRSATRGASTRVQGNIGSGNNYFENEIELMDGQFNGKAFGSNAVALPGAAYVDLDIDNLNDDMYLTYTDPVAQEIETIASQDNASASSKELVVNGDFSDGDTGWNKARSASTLSVASNKLNVLADGRDTYGASSKADTIIGGSYVGQIGVEINSSTQTIVRVDERYTLTAAQYYGHTISADKLINIPAFVATDDVYIGAVSTIDYSDFNLHNVSLKQVLPISTKYRMTNDFSNAVSHDTPFSQADLDLMKVDPLTLMRVWFDGLVLPSGFAKVNIKHYYPAVEGLRGGSTVYDIANP